MTSHDAASDYAIHYLPPESGEWAALLAQFTLIIAARDGRSYAAWASERFARAMARDHAVVALADGRLLGALFFEVADDAIELTFPWTPTPRPALARDLTEAALAVIRDQWPARGNLRIERQLLPDGMDTVAVAAAGFSCHWRKRMLLELDPWSQPPRVPAGYRLAAWNIRELDAAAEVVFAANRGHLDARLYASFFGDSPRECRHGLLSILAGRYGPIHPQATLCAFAGQELAGVNFVIGNEGRLASVIEISVAPAHQGKGLGRALMVGSLQALRDERYERVELAVTAENTPAVRLYEDLGFTDVGKFAVCILPE